MRRHIGDLKGVADQLHVNQERLEIVWYPLVPEGMAWYTLHKSCRVMVEGQDDAMSRTLTISDELYARLDAKARQQRLSIEDLLLSWQGQGEDDAAMELRRRRSAVARIEATRTELAARYGEMPDSVELIREDRTR